MTTLRAAIPDDLHEAVLAQAEREHISVDALISRTLRAAVRGWRLATLDEGITHPAADLIPALLVEP